MFDNCCMCHPIFVSGYTAGDIGQYLQLQQNGSHFTDDILASIFLNRKVCYFD